MTRADIPASASRILDARSLAASHRRLAEVLRPGMRVLDVGCGTGAITRGIAAAAGPQGLAVGADISDMMLAQATAHVVDAAAPRFVRADVFALPFARAFDIVTAARVLQWVSRPGDAVREMAAAAKPGGRLLILDYDHTQTVWTPSPPASMRRFYDAFLDWRADAGFDNAIAGGLPPLLASAGLSDVTVTPQHEHTQRGDTDFETRIGIWADVAASRGHQMVGDGFLAEAERAAAEADYRGWIASGAESQTLYLLAAEGRVPAPNTFSNS